MHIVLYLRGDRHPGRRGYVLASSYLRETSGYTLNMGRSFCFFPGVRIARLVFILPISTIRKTHTATQATTLEWTGEARDRCPSLILGPGNLITDRWDLAGRRAATIVKFIRIDSPCLIRFKNSINIDRGVRGIDIFTIRN